MNLTPEQTKKFWGHVRKGALKGDCWHWEGAKSSKYGVMFIDKVQLGVHRISFALANGPIKPSEFIKHKCGNALCVNPAHLYKRTQITLKVHSQSAHKEFDERCKRYNNKHPFRITEIRDRRLAEYGEIIA
jgi:hypothetical protein